MKNLNNSAALMARIENFLTSCATPTEFADAIRNVCNSTKATDKQQEIDKECLLSFAEVLED